MKKYLCYFFSVMLIFIIGCATTKFYQEPNESITTLVIGKVKFSAKGYTGKDHFFNGTHTSGIEVLLIDPQTNDLIKLRSKGKSGWFYTTKLVSGKYKIARIYFKKEEIDSGRWRSVTKGINRYVKIRDGIVNNLGEFEVRDNGETYDRKVFYNIRYSEVINEFEKNFPESQWLQKERDIIMLYY